jgi:3-phenylpropionate/trans-cinnamate dioxygenase alpha subunit
MEFPYVMGLDRPPLEDWPGPGHAVEPYVTDTNFRNLWSTWLRYVDDQP